MTAELGTKRDRQIDGERRKNNRGQSVRNIFSFFLSVGNIYSPFTSFPFFFPFFVFRLFFSHPFFPVISFSSFLARQPTPGVTEPEFTPAPIRTVPHAFSFAAKLWQRFPILITFLTSSRLLASFTNLAVLPAGRDLVTASSAPILPVLYLISGTRRSFSCAGNLFYNLSFVARRSAIYVGCTCRAQSLGLGRGVQTSPPTAGSH